MVSEPVGYITRESGHGIIAAIVQAISVIGMFNCINMMLAGSRLLYSFGRDGLPFLVKSIESQTFT